MPKTNKNFKKKYLYKNFYLPPFKSFINKTQSRNAKHPYWQEIEIKSEEENERVAMILDVTQDYKNSFNFQK